MSWIQALGQLEASGQAFVMLTIMDIRGSNPRELGAKMVVTADALFDTIGGGALEHQSIALARELLSKGSHTQTQHTEHFNLGTDLKQCCGGVVSVLFEVFPAVNFQLNIFGAGHIGQALIKILADVDCSVNLYDARSHLLSKQYPHNITPIYLSEPELAVEACAAKSYFLIVTHDHALDQQLCEAILTRNDSIYCGLIGSKTKGLKFRQRLSKKGFTPDELRQLTCPMGLGDLKTKKPVEIAISVIAELLQLRNQQIHAKSVFADVKNHSKDADANIIRLETRD